MREAATLAVLLITVGLIVTRPRGMNEGLSAALGAAATLALGTATLADAWRGLEDTAGILAFLLAMMLVSTVAERAGLFEWAASRAVELSGGRGRLLFVNLYLLGAAVTLFLSLDVTAIMVAPVVVASVRRAKLSPLPFVLAVAYVANTASLFLPVSNLTNMLVYGLLGIPFWEFVRLMTLPNLAAMLVNVVVFLILFRTSIPHRFDLPPRRSSSPTSTSFRIAAIGLVLVIVGLVWFGSLGLPLYLPAVVGAAILAPLGLARGELTVRNLAAGVAWSLPPFVVGMYTIVVAAGRSGLNDLWHGVLAGAGASPSYLDLLRLAFASALGANLVNNLPMALVAIAGLQSAGAIVPAAAFATLIGTNVGPNVTEFGSLATMLVLRSAQRGDIHVGAGRYLLIGLLTTPLMVLAAATVLWLVSR